MSPIFKKEMIIDEGKQQRLFQRKAPSVISKDIDFSGWKWGTELKEPVKKGGGGSNRERRGLGYGDRE